MALQSLSKLNIDKALKFAFVCIVIFSLMMSWIYIPQAEAVVAPALVIGAGVGSEVIGSVIATLVMAVTGVCFDNGFFGDTDSLSTMAYEQGYELVRDMMLAGGNVASWLDNAIGLYATTKGFTAGDSIEVPADVLEYARNWVNEKYDFSSGVVSYDEYGMTLKDGSFFSFSDFTSNSFDSIGSAYGSDTQLYSSFAELPVIDLGICYLKIGGYLDSEANEILVGSSICRSSSFSASSSKSGSFASYDLQGKSESEYLDYFSDKVPCSAVLYFDSVTTRLYVGTFSPYFGQVSWATSGISLKNADLKTSTSSISGSDALSVPQTENKVIQVPDVPMVSIGGYSVPAIQQLTGDMVIDKSTSDSEEVVPDVGGIDTEPSFTVPDTWSGIDAWFKAQGLKLTNIFTEVRDFAKAFPQTLNDSLAGVLEGVLEAVNEPVRKIKDKFNEAKNKLLPFIKNGFGFPSIWHYVVAWVGTLGAWLTTMFKVWSGLPYAMVLPVYATAVVVIVIGIYRRFFM